MTVMTIETVFFILAGIWLFVLTITVFLAFRYLAKLGGKTKGKDFLKILEKTIDKEKENSKRLTRTEKEIRDIRGEIELHVQKVGLVKFNPFSQTGGDHSFSLALLDKSDTGIVLTGLHTRERTRIYIKDVDKGKSKFDLSKEEIKAIKKAQTK